MSPKLSRRLLAMTVAVALLWLPIAPSTEAAGTALFFVARGDGSGGHEFSETLEQHNNAVARYLKRLREARRKQASGSSR